MLQRMIGAFALAYTAILLSGVVSKAYCQSKYDSLVSKGEEYAYGAQLDRAEELFIEASRLSPERAEAYFNIAQVHLWIYLGTEGASEYASFTKSCDEAIEKEKKLHGEHPDDCETAYLLGDTYLLRTAAEATDHHYLGAFWGVRSASNYFQKALELNPKFYDAYRGLGEIHYFLDLIPGAVKWALPLVGLFANKEKGFSELRLAYQKGLYDKIRSAFSLAQVYSEYVAEYDSAEMLLRDLVGKFPGNPMFNYHLAIVLIKDARLREAEKYLDVILDSSDPRFEVLNNLCLFLKGDIHFKMNDFSNAVKYNEMFLNKTNKPDYTGMANYRLAISYRALGNMEMMKQCLMKAENGNNSLFDDSYAKRRSEIFLKKGISGDELTVIQMNNDVAAGKFEEAYATLLPIINRITDTDARAEGLLALSESAIKLGKFPDGIRFAKMCNAIDPPDEDWIVPRSWYLIALGSYRCGDIPTAKSYMDKVEATDEYSNNVILSGLVNNLKRKLTGK